MPGISFSSTGTGITSIRHGGDASYQREEGEETPTLTETVNYDYFCVTTQEIERTHSMDDNQLLPVCNAVQDQYYRHEGLYLQSADKEKIDEIFCTQRKRARRWFVFSVRTIPFIRKCTGC